VKKFIALKIKKNTEPLLITPSKTAKEHSPALTALFVSTGNENRKSAPLFKSQPPSPKYQCKLCNAIFLRFPEALLHKYCDLY
jgi:hypothetical protein